MSIGYTWEKLYGAVLALGRTEGTLQDRLASAYREMAMLTPDDFPADELRAEYVQLIHVWRPWAPSVVQGPVAPSPAGLPLDQARALTERLFLLYTNTIRLEEQHYRALPWHAS